MPEQEKTGLSKFIAPVLQTLGLQTNTEYRAAQSAAKRVEAERLLQALGMIPQKPSVSPVPSLPMPQPTAQPAQPAAQPASPTTSTPTAQTEMAPSPPPPPDLSLVPATRPYLPSVSFNSDMTIDKVRMEPNPEYFKQQQILRDAEFASRVSKEAMVRQMHGEPAEIATRAAYFNAVEKMEMVTDDWMDVLELTKDERDSVFVDQFLAVSTDAATQKEVLQYSPGLQGKALQRATEVLAANKVAKALGDYPKEFSWAINTGRLPLSPEQELAAEQLGLDAGSPDIITRTKEHLRNQAIRTQADTQYATTAARINSEYQTMLDKPVDNATLQLFGFPAGTTHQDMLSSDLIPMSGDSTESWNLAALNLLSIMEPIAQELFTDDGFERFGQGGAHKVSKLVQSNPKLAAWESLRLALAVARARAAGERGNLSKIDITPHLEAVPGIWTSKTYAAGYFMVTRKTLEGALNVSRQRAITPETRQQNDKMRAFESSLNEDPNIGWGNWEHTKDGYFMIETDAQGNKYRRPIIIQGGD